MLIKSSGLANNIRHILNTQNQEDIITHQIKLDEMIKPNTQCIIHNSLFNDRFHKQIYYIEIVVNCP